MPWMADLNSESKRASDECATEGEHRSKCNTFGALKEDLNNTTTTVRHAIPAVLIFLSL